MSGEILQEYLIKLGYKTDAISFRRMDASLSGATKKFLGLGTALGGIVAASYVATTAFAYSMRKMYFASDLANSSVKNLKSVGYAAKQIGVSSESIDSFVTSIAQMKRYDPGMVGLMKGLGVNTDEVDNTKVALELLGKLKEKGPLEGVQFAQMFGISQDDFTMLMLGYDKLMAKQAEYSKLAKKMDVDMDTSRANVAQYTGTLDKLGATFDLLEYKILNKFLPVFNNLSTATENWMEGFAYGVDNLESEWDDFTKSWGGIKNLFSSSEKKGPEPTSSTAALSSGKDAKSYLSDLGKKYALPDGLMYKVFGIESAYGAKLDSPAGAQGPFQFMPKTAKSMGLKNPYNFEESADASSKMYARLHKKYNGSTRLAAGAYNWGEGNMDAWMKTGRGMKGQPMPSETQDYMQKVGSQNLGAEGARAKGDVNATVHQTNNFTITGSDSEKISDKVMTKQTTVNAETVRLMKAGFK